MDTGVHTRKAPTTCEFACTTRIFGDKGKAHRWLRKPKRTLGQATPLTYLASEAGARLVEDMLYRIDSGFFA